MHCRIPMAAMPTTFYPPASPRKPGFFQRLGIGWRLTKVSLGILRQEKNLVVLPFLSFLITAAAWGVFFASLFLVAPPLDGLNGWLWYVGLFLLYVFTYFISTYFTAAVIGIAKIRLEGGDPTLKDGFRIASENLGRIFGWALLSATVGMILRAIAERFGFVGRIIAGIAGVAWGIATYLVVPVLIFEKLGPWASLKRSGSLIRQTWGEAAGGYFTLTAVFFLLGLAGLPFLAIGAVAAGLLGLLIGLLVAIVYWLILGFVGAATQGILVTALYRYATTGQVAPGFPPEVFGARF